MTIRSALDVTLAWGETYAARDLDAMMALFEPDAAWIAADGGIISGHAAIRGVFAEFMALDAVYEAGEPHIAEADGIALIRAEWTVRGHAPDGSPVAMEGRTSDVIRRGPDGRWRYIIDSPFGGGAHR
jgi:ketosteroid isomerase-like protein